MENKLRFCEEVFKVHNQCVPILFIKTCPEQHRSGRGLPNGVVGQQFAVRQSRPRIITERGSVLMQRVDLHVARRFGLSPIFDTAREYPIRMMIRIAPALGTRCIYCVRGCTHVQHESRLVVKQFAKKPIFCLSFEILLRLPMPPEA